MIVPFLTIGGGVVAALASTLLIGQAQPNGPGTDLTQIGLVGIAGGLGGILMGLVKAVLDSLKDRREVEVARLKAIQDHELRMAQLQLDADCVRRFRAVEEWMERAHANVPGMPPAIDLGQSSGPDASHDHDIQA